MLRGDVTLNRPFFFLNALIFLFCFCRCQCYHRCAAYGLTGATCISATSKIILVKFIDSGSLWEEKGSLTERCCEAVTH